MAKISRKIIADDVPAGTLKTDSESVAPVQTTSIEKLASSEPKVKSNHDFEDDIVFDNSNTEIAAGLLIKNLGATLFDNLRNNKLLKLPYSDTDRNLNRWLEDLLNTYIRFEDILLIIESLSGIDNAKNHVPEVKAKPIIKEIDNDNLIESLKAELSELKTYKFRQEKKVSASISLSVLADAIPDDSNFKIVKNLLKEAAEEPVKGTDEFIINFISGMNGFLFIAGKQYSNDFEKVENISASLRTLLEKLKGLYISQRRPLLDQIAKIAGGFVETYIFISPEETLQVDPSIHNAKGIGSSRVKEGVSFAVVEKVTGKTVVYADITV